MRQGHSRVIRVRFKPLFPWCLAVLALVFSNGILLRGQETGEISTDQASEWLHWKMFDLHPRAGLSLTYDDNITLSQTNTLRDFITSIAPGISVTIGDPSTAESKHLSLDYGANAQYFSDHHQFDAVDNIVKVNGLLPFSKLTLGASAGYADIFASVVDLANREQQIFYNVDLTSRYQATAKTSVEVNGSYLKTAYPDPQLIGSEEWSNNNWVNNQISPKINLGFGLTFGTLNVDQGAGEVYQRILVRAIYSLSDKLDVTATVGMEFRQFDSTDSRIVISTNQITVVTNVSGTNTVLSTNSTFIPIATNSIHQKGSSSQSPVFNIGAVYRPKDGTTISLNASRQEQNSATQSGYNYTTMGISVNVRQRFWDRYAVSLGGSYENSKYNSVSGNDNSGQTDNYYSIKLGVDALISQRWTVGGSIQHRSSDSNVSGGNIYDDNLVVLQTIYSF